MRVFISWSGELSKKLGEAIRTWLPGVLQAVKPYYTPEDIEKGTRWAPEIALELDQSSVGIICLTKENLQRPWIMFEAGALSKKLGKSHVCPILFGVEPTDIEGPLVQFQATKFEKNDIKKLVEIVNNQCGERKLEAQVLNNVFELWWPQLESTVKSIISGHKDAHHYTKRTDRDLLEEILEITRRNHLKEGKHFHPEAMDELSIFYQQLLLLGDEIQNPKLITLLQGLSRPVKYFTRNSYGIDKDRKIRRSSIQSAIEGIQIKLEDESD